MLRSSLSLITILLATAACTQPVAMVDMRGNTTYGPDKSSYAANTVYTGAPATVVPPVNVGELAPAAGGNYANRNYTYQAPPAPHTWINGPINQSTPVAYTHYTHTPQPASARTIDVRDLAPAAGGNSAPAIWGEPHASNESFKLRPQSRPSTQMVSDVRTVPSDKPVTELERILSNDRGNNVDAAPVVQKNVARAAASGFMWPVSSNKVISSFGPKGGGKINDGINIASAEGEPVWAAADGEVVYVGNELAGYGNMVLIRHAGGKTTAYAHLGRATIDKYDRIRQGDIIGYVGTTGNVREPQLHFAIRDGKTPVDPQKYLNRNVASTQ